LSTSPNVPIGPTTVVGYGGTVVGLIAAILVLIFPDGDEQTIALIASSLFTLGSVLVTQIGRYLQARELAKPVPVQNVVAAPLVTTSSGVGNVVRSQFMVPSSEDPDRPKDPGADLVGDEDLPTDEQEAAAPPPDDDSTVPDNPDNGER
jgi:hypothetical protein